MPNWSARRWDKSCRDRKSTRLNSSHVSISFDYLPSLHDALPIFLPHSESDFVTDCSCPDWANPCKHIAGVYYLLASALDRDPFLMFELRGLSRDDLHAELVRSPLGQILSRSEEHTSELQSRFDLVRLPPFPTRRSSDLPAAQRERFRNRLFMPGLGEPLQAHCRGLLPAGVRPGPRSFLDVRAAGFVQRRLACRTGPLAAGTNPVEIGRAHV